MLNKSEKKDHPNKNIFSCSILVQWSSVFFQMLTYSFTYSSCSVFLLFITPAWDWKCYLHFQSKYFSLSSDSCFSFLELFGEVLACLKSYQTFASLWKCSFQIHICISSKTHWNLGWYWCRYFTFNNGLLNVEYHWPWIIGQTPFLMRGSFAVWFS